MTTPFMQLWVGDYLGDTRHLTTEQHGAYLLLLMTMWRADGTLPADDTKLARIVGLSVTRWNKVKGDIMAMLTIEDGHVTQKRLSAELKKAVEKSERRAEAGRKGGQSKPLKDNDTGQAIASVLLKHSSEPEPKSEPAVATASEDDASELERLSQLLRFNSNDFIKHAANLRTLLDLKAQGCDFAKHILPAAERAARGGKAQSLAYIVPGAIAARDAAKTIAALPTPFEPADDEMWCRRLRVFQEEGVWSPKWGPDPNDAGCRCPEHILKRIAA